MSFSPLRHALTGILLPLYLLILASPAIGANLNEQALEFLPENLPDQAQRIFHAPIKLDRAPENPALFVKNLKPAATIDRINGGAYWIYLELNNTGPHDTWVFDTTNAVVDTVETYLYTTEGTHHSVSGFLHPLTYYLHYGINLPLKPGEKATLLIYMESRFYSGMPSLELTPKSDYRTAVRTVGSWIVGCLGAMLVLTIYNLFIGISMRDRSYLYYSAYLAATIVAWAGATNVLTSLFNWHSFYILSPPFYLFIGFNLLYIIHFLELVKTHKRLAAAAYFFAAFAFFMCFPGSYFFPPGLYQQVHAISSITWIVLGLTCGIIRWREGYKPARYFVAAFGVLFVGISLSIATTIGMAPLIHNTILATLIAQTLDILLLSLALADRINLLRSEKEHALEKLLATESARYRSENRAKDVLSKANNTLLEALAITQKENESKNNFLRMVSHELRTPLHSITAAFRQWDHANSAREKEDILQDINYSTLRLRTQIDNLVLMTETDNNTLESQPFPFEIAPMLDKLCRRVNKQISDKNVELVHKRSPFLPRAFLGDAYLISHLIRTLLDNACKFTDSGEIVFDVEWNEETQCLDILIMDEGCGMSEEQQKVVFKGFVQVSRGLTRQSEGLGLGLTLCHRLGDILDTTISIDSSAGHGTEINLHVPLKKQIKQAITLPPADYRGAILIVEDNLVNAKVLERMVMKMNHPVDIAHSGLEALAAVEKRSYALILMDVQMPDMDGIQVTEEIRRRNITTPIIAVTANSDSSVRRDCRLAGMNDFLVKPVSAVDIQHVLETWQQMNSSLLPAGNVH